METKEILDEIKGSVETLVDRHKQLQTQVDAIDLANRGNKFAGRFETKGIAEEIFENAEFQKMGEMGGRGRVSIKIEDFGKKPLTNAAAGFATTGVLAIDRLPGIG